MEPKFNPIVACTECDRTPKVTYAGSRDMEFLYKVECHGKVGTAFYLWTEDEDGNRNGARVVFDGPGADAWKQT